jgi:hypothetical protein
VPTPPTATPPAASSIPELRFEVQGASSVDYAAVPTISVALAVQAPGGQRIRSLLLDVQIQIAARQRGYTPGSQARLLELFGTPERWRTTLRTLPWTRATVVVPPFMGATAVEVPPGRAGRSRPPASPGITSSTTACRWRFGDERWTATSPAAHGCG